MSLLVLGTLLMRPLTMLRVRMRGLGLLPAVESGIKLPQIRNPRQKSHRRHKIPEPHEILFRVHLILLIILAATTWGYWCRCIVLICERGLRKV